MSKLRQLFTLALVALGGAAVPFGIGGFFGIMCGERVIA